MRVEEFIVWTDFGSWRRPGISNLVELAPGKAARVVGKCLMLGPFELRLRTRP